ncbi:hypothetical protein QOT17_023045 [Balamuthia mandrillaris]
MEPLDRAGKFSAHTADEPSYRAVSPPPPPKGESEVSCPAPLPPSSKTEERRQRLLALRDKRDAIARCDQRKEQKRVARLKAKALSKVSKEVQDAEERKLVNLETTSSAPRKRKAEHCADSQPRSLEDLGPFLEIPALQTLPPGRLAPRTKLEQRIDRAIQEGDFDYADKLSTQLCKEQVRAQIKEAKERKDYAEHIKAEEAKLEARRKKKAKLIWRYYSLPYLVFLSAS